MATFHQDHTIPKGDWIFVFGSNEGGRHGQGAARIARVNFRAEYGCGRGRTGNAYAIPTKDRHLKILPLPAIAAAIVEFLDYARANPKLRFFITRVGCVLAGYDDALIAPLFAQSPENCSLPEPWRQFIPAQGGSDE